MRLIPVVLCLSIVIPTSAQTLDPSQEPVSLTLHAEYESAKSPTSRLFERSETLRSKFPRPYIELGMSINPCGYKTFSGNAAAGLDLELQRFVFKAIADFDTAKKHNDGPIDNNTGHVVGFGSNAFYKFANSWFFGAGMSWGKTITPEFNKEATYPKLVFGKELKSARLQFAYFREENEITHYPTLVRFTPGAGQTQVSQTCHCGNGVNGVESQLWYPNPTLKRHVFFHAVVQPFVFHTTVTDPYNLALTRAQKSGHDFSASLTYSLVYRF